MEFEAEVSQGAAEPCRAAGAGPASRVRCGGGRVTVAISDFPAAIAARRPHAQGDTVAMRVVLYNDAAAGCTAARRSEPWRRERAAAPDRKQTGSPAALPTVTSAKYQVHKLHKLHNYTVYGPD